MTAAFGASGSLSFAFNFEIVYWTQIYFVNSCIRSESFLRFTIHMISTPALPVLIYHLWLLLVIDSHV